MFAHFPLCCEAGINGLNLGEIKANIYKKMNEIEPNGFNNSHLD